MSGNTSRPVIFIGMHRSGTSLLGSLLEKLGLFVGERKDHNNEALFFLELNTWLLAQFGARWDQPEPIAELWSDACSPVLDASQDYVRHLLNSPRAARFLGLRRYASCRSVQALDVPWGWKDPRSTYTLPFWMRLFPEARVVFIERHGVDVAESLRVRARQSIETTTRKYHSFRSVAWFRPKKGGFCESPRCLSLDGGFKLWEAYQAQGRLQIANVPKEKLLHVRYEDLLSNPEQVLENAASFCGLNVVAGQIQHIAATINPKRAYSYQASPDLVRFAKDRKQSLEKYQYSAL